MARSLSATALSIFASRIFILTISIIFTPILVRLLGPTQYGQYAVILSVYGLISIVMRQGTQESIRKYISERTDLEWQSAVFGYVLRPVVVLGLVVGSGFVFAAWSGLAARVFGDAFTSLFYLLGLYAICRQFRTHILYTLMGLQLESRSELLYIIRKVMFVTLSLTVVYLGHGVEGVLIADIMTNTVVAVIGLGFVSREISLRSAISPADVGLPKRQIFNYAISSVFFFLFLTSLYHVDVLLLQYWTSDEVVGYYKGALAIAEVLWLAPKAVQLSILQRVSMLWNRDEIDAIQRKAQLVTRYVFLFTALLTLGMAVLAADFVPLYLGESFDSAVTPLQLLLPGVLGFAMARPTLAINQARRSLRPLLVATGACSLVNLILNLLLIPTYGMIGAAIATSIGYGSLVVFQSLAARHMGYDPLGGLQVRPTLLTLGATAAVIFPLASGLSSSLIALIVVPPVGAIIYVTAAVATGTVTVTDIENIISSIELIPNRVERRIVLVLDRIPKI
ncbi:lipopolysaccharide biosynthesis protein [Natronorubrum thiooxidans]|uniref:Membrane protein involved in the export of O-antigen and teichoic acid n=1 Tax=Natronorubrum thiooxidans TaxID=308853 RepID=A0A1N7FS56_9EURY|nr:polysaccharide biosynthesis C-terminal domain-containing protein [Natronorubrum thiooxidans]SIS03178.1 Membrane protein involved in the export of O-antigen and teichoic acid [Natronorubrum thiooxidans]